MNQKKVIASPYIVIEIKFWFLQYKISQKAESQWGCFYLTQASQVEILIPF